MLPNSLRRSYPGIDLLRALAAVLVLIAITSAMPTLPGPKLLLFVLGSTFALASLSWHLLEKPNLRKYKGPHTNPTREVPA